jgi:hypothetical protein
MRERPEPSEYAPFMASYVRLVPEGDILSLLAEQPAQVRGVLAGVTGERETFRYAPEKWTIREVMGHVCDTERVFGYRALCVARGDQTPLPGFDENTYAARSGANALPLAELVATFERARAAHLDVLRPLSAEAWLHKGTANGQPLSARGQAYAMAGHVLHHLAGLRDRYGVA